MAGGGEDSQPHNPSSSNSTPVPSPDPDASKKSAFTLQKTGEVMLVFALVIIFIVIFCVALHLVLKQRRQHRRRNGPKAKKEKTKKTKKDRNSGNTPELHSVEKKVFEAAGTQVVLCELPEDAPPLQELEAGEIPFDYPFSPVERRMTAMTATTTTTTTTTTSEIEFNPGEVTPMDPWPEGRQLAMYWAGR